MAENLNLPLHPCQHIKTFNVYTNFAVMKKTIRHRKHIDVFLEMRCIDNIDVLSYDVSVHRNIDN